MGATVVDGVEAKVERKRSMTPSVGWDRILSRNNYLFLGGAIVVMVMIMAVTAQWIAPHDPATQSLRDRLTPPFWISGDTTFLLGTDALGRDILSRIIYGARISLLVGIVSVLLAGVLGSALGLVAGYFGRWWDIVIMRLTDAQLAMPIVILAAALVAITDPNLSTLIAVLAINGWKTYCRVVRAEVLSLREQEFITAARALGAGPARIIVRHILPNLFSSISIIGAVTVAQMILAESALSYLGLGVPANIPSWGNMIADGRDYISTGWWISAMPGVAIMVTVIGVNLLGEWLRKRLNPALLEFR